MKITAKGLEMIKEFEGYHKALPDGSCIAYRCPAGVLTIGFGCTKGVKEGMIWTRQQAEAQLLKELASHEAAVARLVTVDLNDNQRDALISFAYNLGNEALRTSTLLRKLNKGDYPGAQAEFMKWTKHKDPKTGKLKTSRGLAVRRAKEMALFAERTPEENEAKGEPLVAQNAEPPVEPMSTRTKVTLAAGAATGVNQAPGILSAFTSGPPPGVTQTVESVSAWKGIGSVLADVGGAIAAAPVAAGILTLGIIAAIWFLPMPGSNKS